MNKVLAIVLAVLVSITVSACEMEGTTRPIAKDTVDTKQETDEEDVTTTKGLLEDLLDALEKDPSDSLEADDGSSSLPSIERTVIVDYEGIKITAEEIVDETFFGLGIKLLIENDTEQDIVVSDQHVVVNNYMVPAMFSATVAAGKKSNDVLHLSNTSLEEAGITSVGEIAFSMRIYDDESWDDIHNTEEIVIHTSAYESMEVIAKDDGKTIFDDGDIRIVGRYVEEDSFWGAGILLFIENASGANIRVSCDDLSINGFMVMPLFSSEVYAGRYALDEITILSSDLEENGIEVIEEVELNIQIYNADSYETIHESGPILFTVE